MDLYHAHKQRLLRSVPTKYKKKDLRNTEMLLNVGPQHPSTHGVLRLEVILSGEMIVDVVPHIGYLHRCFEKHAEHLSYAQIIPYVDRTDYVAAMNMEHAYVMGVEKMLKINNQIPLKVEYIRVLVTELNRVASHFLALGTYGMDLGVVTAFTWMMHDREHIVKLFEWLCGARLLYNYIWVGGLFYDLPNGFLQRCEELIQYLLPQVKKMIIFLLENKIFVQRTANIGILPLNIAINYGVTGPNLRASGLSFDLRKEDAYAVYSDLDFDIPIGKGTMGTTGDCWDRIWVRVKECQESIKIIKQCIAKLKDIFQGKENVDVQKMVPRKIIPSAQDLYMRAEGPRGEVGFFFRSDGKSDVPLRCKMRSPSFSNLSVLPEIVKHADFSDLIAIVGSLDFIMGEIDR